MKLYLLTDRALDELKRNITVEKYEQPNPFIEEQFRGRQYKSSIDIDIELPDLYYKDNGVLYGKGNHW